MKSFTLHGFDSNKDLEIILNKVNRATFADIETSSYKVNNQQGIVYNGSTINAKSISLTYSIVRDSSKEVWETIKNLNDLYAQIIKLEGLVELTLSDEPDYIYDVYIESISEPSEINENVESAVTVTIELIAPYGYARKKDIKVVPLTSESNLVDFESSANIHPVFELEAQEQVISASIITSEEDGSNMQFTELGSGLTVDEINEIAKAKTKKVRHLLDKCNNISSWEQVFNTSKLYSTQVIGTGAELTNTLDAIIPKKVDTNIVGNQVQKRYYWGSNATRNDKFYGALYKKNMVSSLSGEYEIRARFLYETNYPRASNVITLQLLNSDDKPIVSFDCFDTLGKSLEVNVNLHDASKTGLQGRNLYSSKNDKSIIVKNKNKKEKKKITYKTPVKTTSKVGGVTIEKDELVKKQLSVLEYQDSNSISLFYGEVRLTRTLMSNDRYKYTVELILLDENQNIIKRFGKKSYTDMTGMGAYSGANTNVYGYRVFMGGTKIIEDSKITLMKPYKENKIALTNISMFKIVKQEVPEPILEEGDYLVVDSDRSNVSVNGITKNGLLNLASDFPVLSGGKANIILTPAPSDTIKWSVRYEVRKY